MPTFPLPTLSATIGPTGISAPSFDDILNSLVATMQSIFGADIYLPPDSQDFQMLSIFAAAINDVNQSMIAAYNGFSPVFAQGAGLSSLVKINGLAREGATNSTALLTITGVAGTVIAAGVVQDASGNLWNLPPNTTIPNSGTVDVTATCQTAGAIAAPPNTINKISTVVVGWQTATNASAATVGVSAESDAALRQRQSKSTAIAAVTPLQSILAAVANISGVTRSTIYENQTGTPDSNGIPGHSIAVVVLGGDAQTVAATIEATKSPGTGTFGTTTEIVIDPAGVPISISFFELTEVNIFVAVTIQPLEGYVASTGDALIAAIVDFINGLPIGEEVFYNWIFGPAGLFGSPLNTTYRVTALAIGLTAAPTGTADLPIAFNAAAVCATANVTLTTL